MKQGETLALFQGKNSRYGASEFGLIVVDIKTNGGSCQPKASSTINAQIF
jgi:hypothetical protein